MSHEKAGVNLMREFERSKTTLASRAIPMWITFRNDATTKMNFTFFGFGYSFWCRITVSNGNYFILFAALRTIVFYPGLIVIAFEEVIKRKC